MGNEGDGVAAVRTECFVDGGYAFGRVGRFRKLTQVGCVCSASAPDLSSQHSAPLPFWMILDDFKSNWGRTKIIVVCCRAAVCLQRIL